MPSSTPSRSGHAPRLSIVIPASDVATLEDTLVSVLENRPADCEIVAVLAIPYADPWSIGDEVRFVQAPAGASVVDCVNVGMASSGGEIVHILRAGWRATDGWAEAALERFADPDVTAVVPLTVAAGDRGRVVAAGVRRTSGGRSVVNAPARRDQRIDTFKAASVAQPAAPALEAGFWRAEAVPASGFSKACGDRLAAADMAAAVACMGDAVVVEPACQVVEGPVTKRGSWFTEGLHAERLFWRSLAGEQPIAALVAHVGEVIRHAVAAAPLGTLAMLAGRLACLLQFGSCLGRARELNALQAEAGARRRAAADEAGGQIVRIDAGHVPGRPKRRPAAVAGSVSPSGGGRDSSLRRSA
jgi:hypothetical protein